MTKVSNSPIDFDQANNPNGLNMYEKSDQE